MKDEVKLNNFIGIQKHSQFLQSWRWGEFQEKISGKVYRICIQDENKIIAAATIVKKNLPIGKSYFYCPRGPIISAEYKGKNFKNILYLLFDGIKNIASKERVMFLRFEPNFNIDVIDDKIEKTIDVQPPQTLILNLDYSSKELLKNMHQKTRYNIGLAEKKGVGIIEAGAERFDNFWELMGLTSERDGFRLHGIDYYKEMLKTDSDLIRLFFAEYKGIMIAVSLIAFFGDTATYVHGASSDNYRNVMAPYALQWHCIRIAKEIGYKYYDFYGIDEEKWPGVTKFKKGFAGHEVKYSGTFDLAFNQGWYNIYKMVRKTRRTF